MALISGVYISDKCISGAYDDASNGKPTFAQRQRYLAYLESTINGEPGRPRATPESFIPVGETELVDGDPVPAPASPPKPPRKQRKRRPVPKDDYPVLRDDRELRMLARKLTGRD